MFWVISRNLLLLATCLFFIGCGGSVKMAEVEGTIETSDGTPVDRGMLLFTPIVDDEKKKKSKGAVGRIEQGKFTLSTRGKNDGIAIGRHRVRLTEGSFDDDANNEAVLPESLEVEIRDGMNNIQLVVDVVPKPGDEADGDDDD